MIGTWTWSKGFIIESKMRHCYKVKDKDVPINQNVTDRQPTNE